MPTHLIRHHDRIPPGARLGGKAGALARLGGTALPIPEWFVILPEAFPPSRAGAEFRLEAGLADAVLTAARGLGTESGFFAVRSSAVDEDGAEHSFAGQLDSFLFVPLDRLLEKVEAVWRSGFSERILAYRRERGLPESSLATAVLVQRMIEADSAGVAFSADPVGGHRGHAIVSAVFGLGSSLVSGECDADTFTVGRDGRVLHRAIARKTTVHLAAPNSAEGIAAQPLPPTKGSLPALTDEHAQTVAALARSTARFFGRPQDIEWALSGDKIWLLQSRPITSLGPLADPDGELTLWDNANIAESYSGVTTPLTFSFARSIYEAVYREFARLMGVSARTVEANRDLFPRMLGLIRGQVFYNLISWYRLLALLPGFSVNRGFMEQMMGVKEGLPPEVLAKLVPAGRWAKFRDALALTGATFGLVRNHLTLPRQITRFYVRLNDALRLPAVALEEQRPDELAAHYRDLERQLLLKWDAPLVNDFFAMIFYGVAKKLTARWCNDRDGSLQNDLLCGEGGMISAEPAQRVRELVALVTSDEPATTLLCTGTRAEIERWLPTAPEFAARYQAYLDKFGDRCLEELKLESLTLHDDPMPLLVSIGQYARRFGSAGAADTGLEKRLRADAEKRVAATLEKKRLRRWIFTWVLNHARARVRDRENLRFERTRLFGRVRRLFLELGKRFHAEGRLADPRDIFYLSVEEALGFVEGTAVSANLRDLAVLRRKEFDGYRASPPPSNRFSTRGAVHLGNAFRSAQPAVVPTGDSLQGTGCCPGVVRARARVILDPRAAAIEPGEILVAPRTDPGWIMLFPSAAGVLVEYGSLLSHSAIVAREMGIPAIVSIEGITQWARTGDLLEMDGATGVVRRVEAAPRAIPAAEVRPVGTRRMSAATEAAATVDFTRIRYAQVWEDADILLDALAIQPTDTVLSIASAGDNALALLGAGAARVVALDLNPAQLACLELRVAAYRTLEHRDLLVLIGSRPGGAAERLDLYRRCRPALSPRVAAFWDAHTETVAQGIGGGGKFENYFRLFRSRLLPLVHGRRMVARLLQGGTPEVRTRFYAEHWNTWRWRLLFRFFFSRFMMGRLGRDPAFFKYVEGSVATRILARVEHALTALNPADNPYLHWILTGTHGDALPWALRAENFDRIRQRLDRLEWHESTLEAFLAREQSGRSGAWIDKLNLSDIFEYMSEANTAALLTRLAEASRPGARFAYWNMLAPRSRPESLASHLHPRPDLAAPLFAQDKAFFYSAFVVEERR